MNPSNGQCADSMQWGGAAPWGLDAEAHYTDIPKRGAYPAQMTAMLNTQDKVDSTTLGSDIHQIHFRFKALRASGKVLGAAPNDQKCLPPIRTGQHHHSVWGFPMDLREGHKTSLASMHCQPKWPLVLYILCGPSAPALAQGETWQRILAGQSHAQLQSANTIPRGWSSFAQRRGDSQGSALI